MEDLAYRRLIDEYYLSERPFNGCSTDVSRHIGMSEQESSVSYVLNRYFVFQDNKWVHERIEKELDSFKSKQEKAVLAGRASAESRKNKGNRTDVQRSLNERSTTVQPTNNQEPITNNQNINTTTPRKAVHVDKPHDVSEAVWTDFLKIRKQKRAPLSETALDGIRKEADKAGMTLQSALEHCCSRGWQGFQADWLAKPRQNAGQSPEPKWAKEKRERMEEFLGKRSRTIEMQSVEIVQESLQ